MFLNKTKAKIPDKKATKTPKQQGPISCCASIEDCVISTDSKISEPMMIGIDSKNEKLKAVSFSTPQSIKAVIVEPLLESPGKTAIPCKTPVKVAFLTSKHLFWLFAKILVSVKRKQVAMKPSARKEPFKTSGANFLNSKAMQTVGIVATTR